MKPARYSCGACRRFEPATLEGYGYCRAGRTAEERARFLPCAAGCVFSPPRFQENPHACAPAR